MFNTNIRRSTLAAAVLIPAFLLITPALASAATVADPGTGQNYSNSQTTTDSNGVHSSKVSSTMGPDGKVNYRRSEESANGKGRSESNTYSGAMNDSANPSAAGQNYRNTQTTTDANGTHTTTVDSTMGPDGKVNYSRHSETANADGRSESNTRSGPMNPAADQANSAPAAVPANPAGRTLGAGGAPLIIVNTPGAPAGM